MATKKKRAAKRKAVPKRRRKSAAPRASRPARKKGTVRGQSDGELARVFAAAVRAGHRATASKARGEMKRRSEFGEFDAARFPVSADVLKESSHLLRARKRRA